MKHWTLYNFIVANTIYWIGNIILWYPWSINERLGIMLMLTVMPFLWGYGIYHCIIRYKGKRIVTGSVFTALILIATAVILDFIFFGLIRGTFTDLYKPTTFYGYAFLVTLPIIEAFVLKKLIIKNKRRVKYIDFLQWGTVGLASLAIQIVLINL
jgi:hypothetical protein